MVELRSAHPELLMDEASQNKITIEGYIKLGIIVFKKINITTKRQLNNMTLGPAITKYVK